MGLGVARTTEPLTFNTGIGTASYAEVMDSPVAGKPTSSLLPGATTVTQAVEALFGEDRSVAGEVMSALVAGNPATLRTPGGFREAAYGALASLRENKSEASQAAGREIETLLADTELFERYRMSLLET